MTWFRFASPATAAFFFFASIFTALLVGKIVSPTWTIEKIMLDVNQTKDGKHYYTKQDKKVFVTDAVPIEDSKINPPSVQHEFVYEIHNEKRTYYLLNAKKHWGIWSLLPPIVALTLCWLNKEPITSLTAGIITGALILQKYDVIDQVIIPSLSTKNAATVVLLYLWLLGGLLGIWSRTGAAHAFAKLMTDRFVTGPRSAKLVTWLLGVVFFQGGTVSTVLVGTTVKPIADKNRVSHEELSYVVDSTASPIASQLAFNAWPGYVQAFIFVAGVPFLATEADRITFFFKSVPFCFYAIFAVLGTFLLSIEKAPFLGSKLRKAMQRARKTGKLDADGSHPLTTKELIIEKIPNGYKPNVLEFFLPLGILIVTAVGTFIYTGTPNVPWAFFLALAVAFSIALIKGMPLGNLLEGFGNGLKGVVVGSVILLLAITIGGISKEVGGGVFLVDTLQYTIPYWLLPVCLQLITMFTAFSTGTSWGTYAIAFPLAMPLAWAVAMSQGLSHPEFFMTICFAAVMDGSVYGDQCSPISDTTVLSAMSTGCDLMDHVTTQIPQATVAALIAAIGWTSVVAIWC